MVNPVVSGTTPLPPKDSSGSPNSSTSTLAGNFQSFLTLLTTQLKNQNPLDPLDTNQFTQQLVQFAGVEQQLKTNETLAALIAVQQSTQSTQALGFVGRVAVVDGDTSALANGAANWNLDVPSDCNLSVSITNSAGQTVFTGDYSANAGKNQPFTWDGKDNTGTLWKDGSYKLTATATDGQGQTVGVTTHVQGTVSAVDLSQSPPLLTINGQTYLVNQIRSIIG
ncbi:MAG TPA: flagellar hook capping FlgD N-terminal domain-containing protein [Bradyrhizobium sp.]|nr:flagellar hook capping FlgD N-terminal domain-containing protein [Bradyrhizobium sp.]